jgi:hypothetical protein
MTRSFLLAAAAAAVVALTAPAQAHMANPGLASAVTPQSQASPIQTVRYRHHRYRSWRHHYARHPRRHRHCWNDRVRVRVPGGYFVWRTHRRCGWRYY